MRVKEPYPLAREWKDVDKYLLPSLISGAPYICLKFIVIGDKSVSYRIVATLAKLMGLLLVLECGAEHYADGQYRGFV